MLTRNHRSPCTRPSSGRRSVPPRSPHLALLTRSRWGTILFSIAAAVQGLPARSNLALGGSHPASQPNLVPAPTYRVVLTTTYTCFPHRNQPARAWVLFARHKCRCNHARCGLCAGFGGGGTIVAYVTPDHSILVNQSTSDPENQPHALRKFRNLRPAIG